MVDYRYHHEGKTQKSPPVEIEVHQKQVEQPFDGEQYVEKARVPGAQNRDLVYRLDGVGVKQMDVRMIYKPIGKEAAKRQLEGRKEAHDTVELLHSEKPIITNNVDSW